MVGLACALGEVFGLVVPDGDLRTQESDLAVLFIEPFFELLNIVIISGVRPRLFASGRELFVTIRVLCFQHTNGRVRPRLFANVRLASFHDQTIHRSVVRLIMECSVEFGSKVGSNSLPSMLGGTQCVH